MPFTPAPSKAPVITRSFKGTLGRNLSNGANGTVNIELIQPGTMFGPRQQSVDFRLSKRFRFGTRRVAGNLDLYNFLNSTGISTVNTTTARTGSDRRSSSWLDT
jgi:hypothetical protein